MTLDRFVRITPGSVMLDGKETDHSSDGRHILPELYRALGVEYPKFFKMDTLCKLGFVASELLLKDDNDRFVPREDRAVLMFGSNGSFDNDGKYLKTIEEENYYPSPSLFVYTLPNIITGEICIRNRYHGDSTAFVLPGFDADGMMDALTAAFSDRAETSALCGWVDCRSEDDFDALAMLVSEGGSGEGIELKSNIIKQLFEYGKID